MPPSLSVTEIPLSDLEPQPALHRAYVQDFESVREFFPHGPDRVEDAVAAVRSGTYPRRGLIPRLERYLDSLGGSEASLRSLRRLLEPQSVVVATGQQPVLGTPLLVLYKAMTAVATARWLESRGLGPAVPIFWCHSADHDLDEVNDLGIVTREGDYRRLRAQLDLPPRTPIEDLGIQGAVAALWEEALALLPGGEFRDEMLRRTAPLADDTAGTWMNRILLSLLGDQGLVVLEPRILRDLYGPFLDETIRSSDTIEEEMRRRSEILIGRSFETPLEPYGGPFLFRLGPGPDGRRSRDRIRFVGPDRSEVEIGGSTSRFTRESLLADASSYPTRYSPTAALRPVFQSALFPVAVAVGGPGEIAYHAQLGGTFSRLSVPMPVILPRFSATLVDGKNARFLEDLAIPDGRIPELARHLDAGSTEEDARELLSPGIRRRRDDLERDLEAFGKALTGEEPSLEKPVEKALQRTRREMERLVSRFIDARSRSEQTSLRRRQRLLAHLAPGGNLQERRLSSLPFLFTHGFELVDHLLEAVEPFRFTHRIVRIPRQGLPKREDAAATVPSGTPYGQEGSAGKGKGKG